MTSLVLLSSKRPAKQILRSNHQKTLIENEIHNQDCDPRGRLNNYQHRYTRSPPPKITKPQQSVEKDSRKISSENRFIIDKKIKSDDRRWLSSLIIDHHLFLSIVKFLKVFLYSIKLISNRHHSIIITLIFYLLNLRLTLVFSSATIIEQSSSSPSSSSSSSFSSEPISPSSLNFNATKWSQTKTINQNHDHNDSDDDDDQPTTAAAGDNKSNFVQLIRPVLRVSRYSKLKNTTAKEPNRLTTDQSNDVLIINLELLSLFGRKNRKLPFELKKNQLTILLTAKNFEQNYGLNSKQEQYQSTASSFLSSNLVFTKQEKDPDHDHRIHQTIETKTIINHLDYYSNDVIENLLSTSNQNHDHHPTSNSTIHHQCQLFTGFVPELQTLTSSLATISICHDGKLNGIISLDRFGQLILEHQTQSNNTNAQAGCRFQIFNTVSNSTHRLVSTCQHRLMFLSWKFQAKNNIKHQPVVRKKRSDSLERTIEMLVVTDHSMHLYHGSSLHNYVFTLIAMVSHIFEHSSIGNEMNLRLVKFISLVDEAQTRDWYGSAHKTLRNFCQWQFVYNQQSDDHPQHYDTAIFFTRIDLCSDSDSDTRSHLGTFSHHRNNTCDTLGMAHSGQICDPQNSCAIVEDNGLSAAFTVAHELGHLLGIPHDEDEQCARHYTSNKNSNDNNNVSSQSKHESNVMVRIIDSTSRLWSWSSCSKHFLNDFLDSGHGDCLSDKNSDDILNQSLNHFSNGYQRRSFYATSDWVKQLSKLPGVRYNADAQCKLMFENNSTVCSDSPICKKLWCTTNIGSCRTQHTPWADGTECGHRQWCQEGECVRIDRTHQTIVNGNWSEWSPWSDCSLPCDGGIQKSYRECTRPRPQNGGKHCLGKRTKYQSCNDHPCSSSQQDARSQQCSEFNQKHQTVWTPHYGVSPSDVCALYCTDSRTGESHKLKPKVTDGTRCTPDSFDICVNGKCLSAGCDRILGSPVKHDYCGVCNGDNSTCREISGQFRPKSVSHGYFFVLSIPPGASHIEITKERSPDENWLALRDESGNYLFNGNFNVNLYEKKWYYRGTAMEYSGTKKHGFERVNITRTTNTPLHLEVLCVGELRPPTINYRFVVISDNPFISYRWSSQSRWSSCSKACNGEQELKPFCLAVHHRWPVKNVQAKISETKVADQYCHEKTKPSTVEFRVCNTHCELEWHIYQVGACSSKCGSGFRSVSVNCTQTLSGHKERIFIDDVYCSHLTQKPSDQERCNGNECIVSYQWRYSEWSACSFSNQQQTCGTGQQTRKAHCVSLTQTDHSNVGPNSMVESTVPNEYCIGASSAADQSPQTQICQVECPRWSLNSWTNCMGECDFGEKIRTVVCLHGNQQVGDAYCESIENKPVDRMTCELEAKCSLPSPPEKNDYNALLHDQQFSVNSRNVDFTSNQPSSINRINPKSVYQGPVFWKSGEWSSCDTFYQRLTDFQQHLLSHFLDVPKCFNTSTEVEHFKKQYAYLFKFNETLHEKSYTQLASLMNVKEADFFRRRLVACVMTSDEKILTDSECDLKTRPQSEDYCPLLDNHLHRIPQFNIEFCSKTIKPIVLSTNNNDHSISIVSMESEPKSNNILDSFYFSPGSSSSIAPNNYQQIRWHSSDWKDCYCDATRKIWIRTRSVVCIRQFSVLKWENINDAHCESYQTKPKDLKECLHLNKVLAKKLECQKELAKEIVETNFSPSPSFLDLTISENKMLNIFYFDEQKKSTKLFYNHKNPLSSTTVMSLPSSISTSIIDQQTTTATYSLPSIIVTAQMPQFDDQPKQSIVFDDQPHRTMSNSIIDPDHISSQTTEPPYNQIHSTLTVTRLPGPSFDEPITRWTEWSECSATCGNGTKRRDLICIDQKQSRCDLVNFQPQTQYQPCYRMCSFFQWHITEWSPCSVQCGRGTRTRQIECHDWTGASVPKTFCNEKETKASLRESCQMADCKMIWRTGPWSECSESCGQGHQSRTVTCHRINSHGFVDPTPVEFSNEILTKRKRRQARNVRDWINKKNTINRSKKKRRRRQRKRQKRQKPSKYRNIDYKSHYHQSNWCNIEQKPVERRHCQLGYCLMTTKTAHHSSSLSIADAYVWKVSQWQTCSRSCGMGEQYRKLFCYSQLHNLRVRRSQCNPKFKPEKSRRCDLRSCEVISCQDMRDRGMIRKDGEFRIWMQGASIRVYCFGMDHLTKPLEYLVLNDVEENFSELDARSSNCLSNSISPMVNGSIRFHFKYVRFDVANMEIDANDTRFLMPKFKVWSHRRKKNHDEDDRSLSRHSISDSPLGFGQAFIQGCPMEYQPHNSNIIDHSRNCYFGLNPATTLKAVFSINLRQTGLVLDDRSADPPDHQWTITGSRYLNDLITKSIQISTNDEKIFGRCSFKKDTLPRVLPTTSNNHDRWCRVGCQPREKIIKLKIL